VRAGGGRPVGRFRADAQQPDIAVVPSVEVRSPRRSRSWRPDAGSSPARRCRLSRGILWRVGWEGASRAIRIERWCACCARWREPSSQNPRVDTATAWENVAVVVPGLQPHLEAAAALAARLRALTDRWPSGTPGREGGTAPRMRVLWGAARFLPLLLSAFPGGLDAIRSIKARPLTLARARNDRGPRREDGGPRGAT
jgi:hypothetical protein